MTFSAESEKYIYLLYIHYKYITFFVLASDIFIYEYLTNFIANSICVSQIDFSN